VISTEQLTNMVASGKGRVVGSAGERIGKVAQVFLDDETGRPGWVTAKAGMFSGEWFIPLVHATLDGNDLVVPFAEDEIKDAPRVKGEGGHLSETEEARLYAYYGLNFSDIARTPALCTAGGIAVGAGNEEGDENGVRGAHRAC
jgi:PRC-barrel domain protein